MTLSQTKATIYKLYKFKIEVQRMKIIMQSYQHNFSEYNCNKDNLENIILLGCLHRKFTPGSGNDLEMNQILGKMQSMKFITKKEKKILKSRWDTLKRRPKIIGTGFKIDQIIDVIENGLLFHSDDQKYQAYMGLNAMSKNAVLLNYWEYLFFSIGLLSELEKKIPDEILSMNEPSRLTHS